MSGIASADEPRLNRYLAYDSKSGPYVEWQVAQFEGVLGSRILEVGCGVGSVAQILLPRELYVGLDGHFRRYRTRELREKIESAGFEIRQIRNFNALGAIGWWLRYRLFRRADHGAGHLNSMSIVAPVLRRVERLIPPPIGLSLVAVGVRK